MDQSLTEGARRALISAEGLASRCGVTAVEPGHLLWTLWDEGSRAAEILAAHGITDEAVAAICEFDVEATQPSADETSAEEDLAIPHSVPFQAVIEAARRHAVAVGRHVEVGSEHLLLGLVTSKSSVAAALQDHGLDELALVARISDATGFSDAPIDADFTLTPVARTETDRTDTLRIIDAAINRAREGLRVVEDFVRFSCDDVYLTGLLKKLRHDLTSSIGGISAVSLLAARETSRDVGTDLSTAAEGDRATPQAVLRANLKRAEEALRTLEEFGKVVDPQIGVNIQAIRYRLYTIEKAILSVDENRRRLQSRQLYLLVTEELCDHGAGPAIRESLAAGVDIVQLREKTMSEKKLLDFARRVRAWTTETGALFIMNDRPDLAVLSDADGVHVGQQELSVHEARRIVGPGRLVGVSTHNIEQARQAVIDGADYIGVGPVFASTTKQFSSLAGLDFVRQVAGEIKLPWFAIGGIDEDNIKQLVDAGATRVAVSSVICGSQQPGEVTANLRASLQLPELGDS